MRYPRGTSSRRSRHACAFVFESWGPHPGCAEFMTGPEAVIPCTKPATHVARVTFPWQPGDREKVRMCAGHTGTMAGEKFYRFRRLGRP